MAEREVHVYETDPEPDFKFALRQAATRYFVPNEDNTALRYQPLKIREEYPNIVSLAGFMAIISNTTSILYSIRQYNRYKPEAKFIVLKSKNFNPTLNN